MSLQIKFGLHQGIWVVMQNTQIWGSLYSLYLTVYLPSIFRSTLNSQVSFTIVIETKSVMEWGTYVCHDTCCIHVTVTELFIFINPDFRLFSTQLYSTMSFEWYCYVTAVQDTLCHVLNSVLTFIIDWTPYFLCCQKKIV